MAARATTCRAKVHSYSTRCPPAPSPWGPLASLPRSAGGGWSLSGGQAGDLKTQWGGPAPAQATEAGFKLSAWLAHHPWAAPH